MTPPFWPTRSAVVACGRDSDLGWGASARAEYVVYDLSLRWRSTGDRSPAFAAILRSGVAASDCDCGQPYDASGDITHAARTVRSAGKFHGPLPRARSPRGRGIPRAQRRPGGGPDVRE